MGIPRLTSLLKPYAPLTPLTGEEIIIDGPGFAYHIYGVCVKHASVDGNYFDAAQSYEELGAVAIAWLRQIELEGNTIVKIFFDGFLPSAKLDTRHERLSAQTSKHAAYYKSCLNPPRAPSKVNAEQLPPMFLRYPTQNGTQLTPPFLVPAILEVLGTSHRYKDMTQVVPGEADAYCAAYVNQHGGIVFTGDSDLLVHDLGPDGTVCFFDDLERRSNDTSTISWRKYHPTKIAEQLSLPVAVGLLSLGFELHMDNHYTLLKAVSQAKVLSSATKFESQYSNFKESYSLGQVDLVLLKNSFPNGMCEVLRNMRSLDPRISEYVLQFPHILNFAQKGPAAGSPNSLYMFLPVLLDCPARTSAWESSTPLRLLAYGLMNYLVPDDQQRVTVHEHRTRQRNAIGKALQLPEISNIANDCTAVTSLISQVKGKHPQAPSELLWVAIAAQLDLSMSLSLGKPAISVTVLDQLAKTTKKAETFKTFSWEAVHLHAHVHGTLYSLRILHKITALVIAYPKSRSLPNELLTLFREIGTLPNLTEYPDIQRTVSVVQSIGLTKVVASETSVPKAKSPSSKSKKHTRIKPAKEKKRTNTINPFHALSVD